MPTMRKSAIVAAIAGILGLAELAAAQQLEHVCFTANEGGGYLRIEWPGSQQWAIYRWLPGATLRIFLAHEQAQWCWGARFADMTRACRPGNTQPATPSC